MLIYNMTEQEEKEMLSCVPWNTVEIESSDFEQWEELHNYFVELEAKRPAVEAALKMVVRSRYKRIGFLRKKEMERVELLRKKAVPFRDRQPNEERLRLCDEEEMFLKKCLVSKVRPMYQWVTLEYKYNWKLQVQLNLRKIYESQN